MGRAEGRRLHLQSDDREPASLVVRELACQASFSLVQECKRFLMQCQLDGVENASDLEDVINGMAFRIECMNNWKGVLQWLDDND